MRILYHHRTQSKDGMRVHIDELIGALRGLGHEVIVVEPPQASGTEFGASSRSIDLLKRLAPKALYELMECAYSVVAYRRLLRAYREYKPDVLYERYNLFLFAGAWLRRRHGLPMLLEVNAPLAHERALHGGLGLRALADRAERYVWRRADAVLPVTAVLAQYVQRAGVPAERLHVIPNGIRESKFASYPSLDEAKRAFGIERYTVLGFTGFVRDWHGLDRIVEFLAEPDHEGCMLFVVGDGPARAGLEAQARRLGIAERVRFTGVVDHERVIEHVAAFDVALQPAATDYASPLKLFEYMALGRAILAPAQPNLLEVLAHDRNALLFAPGDPDGMRRALQRLTSDAAVRERLGAAARASIDACGYTWTGNARKVERLARKMLGPSAPGGG